MGDGSLSQAEIDALLSGADDIGMDGGMSDTNFGSMGGMSSNLSDEASGFLSNNWGQAMQIATNMASSRIGRNIRIETPFVEEVSLDSVSNQISNDNIIAQINLGSTQSVFILTNDQAKKISSSMMGSDPNMLYVDEAHLSSLSEFFNTIMVSVASSLERKFNDNLSPSAPIVRAFSNISDLPSSSSLLQISYNLQLDNSNLGKLVHLIDIGAISRWVPSSNNQNSNMGSMNHQMGGQQQQNQNQGNRNFTSQVNPVSFPTFQGTQANAGLPPNYELLLDVQMTLTVELGRTTKYVKDVLGLGEGSIIELDKLAGEPIDLLVNGKLIAKGEVVVIDENFGVRVTDIVGMADRLTTLGG